jgi:hypothetical protein
MHNEWEYDDFEVFPLDGKPVNMGTVGSEVSYADIILHGWADARPKVFEGIQTWFDKGWEAVTPIGPDCMEVEIRRGFFVISVISDF